MQNFMLSLSNLMCATIGHHYNITNKITNHINEYKCSSCGKEVTEDILGNIEDLTLKQKNINKSVALFFQKKMHRKYFNAHEKPVL